MRVGSAPTPASCWKPLLSGCRKQKSRREGKEREKNSSLQLTKPSSKAWACPLSPPPSSSPDPGGHFTRESQCPGHLCPGVMELAQHWQGAPRAPSVATSSCLALPQTMHRGHGPTDSQLQGCFLAQMQSQGHVFSQPGPARCFLQSPEQDPSAPAALRCLMQTDHPRCWLFCSNMCSCYQGAHLRERNSIIFAPLVPLVGTGAFRLPTAGEG